MEPIIRFRLAEPNNEILDDPNCFKSDQVGRLQEAMSGCNDSLTDMSDNLDECVSVVCQHKEEIIDLKATMCVHNDLSVNLDAVQCRVDTALETLNNTVVKLMADHAQQTTALEYQSNRVGHLVELVDGLEKREKSKSHDVQTLLHAVDRLYNKFNFMQKNAEESKSGGAEVEEWGTNLKGQLRLLRPPCESTLPRTFDPSFGKVEVRDGPAALTETQARGLRLATEAAMEVSNAAAADREEHLSRQMMADITTPRTVATEPVLSPMNPTLSPSAETKAAAAAAPVELECDNGTRTKIGRRLGCTSTYEDWAALTRRLATEPDIADEMKQVLNDIIGKQGMSPTLSLDVHSEETKASAAAAEGNGGEAAEDNNPDDSVKPSVFLQPPPGLPHPGPSVNLPEDKHTVSGGGGIVVDEMTDYIPPPQPPVSESPDTSDDRAAGWATLGATRQEIGGGQAAEQYFVGTPSSSQLSIELEQSSSGSAQPKSFQQFTRRMRRVDPLQRERLSFAHVYYLLFPDPP